VHSRFGIGAAIAAAAASGTLACAADAVWSGTANSSWSNANNWNPKSVPTGNLNGTLKDLATIPGTGVSAFPSISASAGVGGLVMEPGSELTIASGTFTVYKHRASSLGGTIRVQGSSSFLSLSAGLQEWTNDGIIEFGSGGNFSPIGGAYGTLRTLSNNGTVRGITGSIVYVPFTTVSGGTLDGAWRARSTIPECYIGGVLSPYYLSLSSATLGSSFTAVADSEYAANLWLMDGVTNNSVANSGAGWSYPAAGTMSLAVSSGSTFAFAGSGGFSLQGQNLGGVGVNVITNGASHTLGGYGTFGPAVLGNAGTVHATGGTAGVPQTLHVGSLSNQGSVIVDQYNTLAASGAVAGEEKSIFRVDGTVTAPSMSIGGTITGSGTVHSTVMLTGVIAPGDSPGTLRLDGLSVGDGARYDYEAGDLIAVNGTLEFAPGAVMTICVPAGMPDGRYPVLTFDSIVGTPHFTLGGVEGTIYQEGNSFGVQVPEPTVLGLAGVVCLLSLVRRPVR